MTYTPSHKRGLGMVFQNYALFPHLTIYENIAFPLRMRKMRKAAIDEQVARVLNTVQLPDVQDRFASELSGGQQQRIALARCFVYEPSIILMDEPLGALDKKLRDSLQREIKHLHDNLGITVIYVTHDQEEAMVMSDRICLMNEGRIEQIGSPADLYFQPNSIFAADFLGESNLFAGKVIGQTETGTSIQRVDDIVVSGVCDAEVRNGETAHYMIRPENIRKPSVRSKNSSIMTPATRRRAPCSTHAGTSLRAETFPNNCRSVSTYWVRRSSNRRWKHSMRFSVSARTIPGPPATEKSPWPRSKRRHPKPVESRPAKKTWLSFWSRDNST